MRLPLLSAANVYTHYRILLLLLLVAKPRILYPLDIDVMCLIQFGRYEQHDERISERDFAESLVVYAGYNSKRRVRMLKRVKKAFKDEMIVSNFDL